MLDTGAFSKFIPYFKVNRALASKTENISKVQSNIYKYCGTQFATVSYVFNYLSRKVTLFSTYTRKIFKSLTYFLSCLQLEIPDLNIAHVPFMWSYKVLSFQSGIRFVYTPIHLYCSELQSLNCHNFIRALQ